MLDKLYKEYKMKNKELDKDTTSQYMNYLDAILDSKNILTNETLRSFKAGNRIHYVAETIIGKNIYNAKILEIGDNSIIFQPTGWKGKALKFNIGDELFISKGWI